MEEEKALQKKAPGMIAVFVRDRFALACLILLVILIVVCFGAPLYLPQARAFEMDTAHTFADPSPTHALGTDEFGRDYLARLIYGGRISLFVGITCALVAGSVGIVMGSIAGYYGGLTETLIMRFTDMMLGLPTFFLLILFAAIMTPSAGGIVLIYSSIRWTMMARIVRAEYLSLRERDYVAASRVVGNSNIFIIIKDILPNALSPIVVMVTLAMAFAMLMEASLSYLGLGVMPPTPSWGNMLTLSQRYFIFRPIMGIIPGLMIFFAAFSFNIVGQGLRDAFDRQMR